MFSGTTKYIMDANVIKILSVADIRSKINNNRIIATIPDVKHEVQDSISKLSIIHLDNLNSDAYKKIKDILKLQCVKNVINYYNNKGTADVVLLAHALTVGGTGILSDEVVIVTNDVTLRHACDELGIIWKSAEDFKLI